MSMEPANINALGSSIQTGPSITREKIDFPERQFSVTDRATISAPSDLRRIHKLTILHTNDLHGHAEAFTDANISEEDRVGGLANLGSVIQKEKEKDPEHTLLLDADCRCAIMDGQMGPRDPGNPSEHRYRKGETT